MRLDGFTPTAALPARNSTSLAPIEQGVKVGAPSSAPKREASSNIHVAPTKSAEGEYLPAHRGSTQAVHGYANQAMASYQAMASLPDAELDGVSRVDIFV